MKFDSRLAMLALPVVIAFGLIGLGRSSLAANPSAAQALKLTPDSRGRRLRPAHHGRGRQMQDLRQEDRRPRRLGGREP